MRIERLFRIDSIMLGCFTLVLAYFSAQITWGQQPDEHLISPVVVKVSSYFELKNPKSLSASPANCKSTRRREIASKSSEVTHQAALPAKVVGKSDHIGTRLQQKQRIHQFQQANSSDVVIGKTPRGGIVQANVVQDSAKSFRVTPVSFATQDEEQQDPDDSETDSGQDSDDAEETEESDEETPAQNDRGSFWVRKKIQDVRTNIQELDPSAPTDRSSELEYGMTDWSVFRCAPKTFAWVAPDIRYQPLYFEDVALERYGQTLGFHRQTFRSGFHFFKSAITYPNKLRHDAKTCDYPLGFCRPGTCVPAIEQKRHLGRPR